MSENNASPQTPYGNGTDDSGNNDHSNGYFQTPASAQPSYQSPSQSSQSSQPQSGGQQSPYGQAAYGQASGQQAYGQSSQYGQAYGQQSAASSYEQQPYGQPQNDQSPYGQAYGPSSQYGEQAYGQSSQYGEQAYSQSSQYGQQYGPSYGQSAYGQQPYGRSPYGQPAPGWYPAYDEPSYQRWNILSIVGFVLAFPIPPVGLVLSIIALVQINKSREKSKGLAIAGIVVGAISTALLTAVIMIAVFAFGQAMDYAVYDRDGYGYSDDNGGYGDYGDVTTDCAAELDGQCYEWDDLDDYMEDYLRKYGTRPSIDGYGNVGDYSTAAMVG
ncbi:DUF4190 domain-containing protein [Bifidobacterium amazonense]|uniref:DUF4190 domain-containing protein n=1 Tax=Bifidobacterium amazonense TaxID=2809027 RepID=A0ABS9VTZ2_9BIFI|nr:DUF4190 domain-containing protein [Bifidobacterium amazonense]MCH9275560.1 DUF4190 domain-containing protein [Bifidobacterium amazonense]MCH9275565.1 DUF4190 domain-containing protein [Bifidobacterium amazonense]